ncbi:MAG: hypothetical protein OEQ53_10945, partial [Saprospiraceae bacterium]|nr:hypothetical protein [Saprospiraceae bacterium]
ICSFVLNPAVQYMNGHAIAFAPKANVELKKCRRFKIGFIDKCSSQNSSLTFDLEGDQETHNLPNLGKGK